nr:MAG TPA: hypothetical protein [Caudoviricetes sp.]
MGKSDRGFVFGVNSSANIKLRQPCLHQKR